MDINDGQLVSDLVTGVVEQTTKKVPRKYFVLLLIIIIAITLWFIFKT